MLDPEEAVDAGEWRSGAGDGVSNELLMLESEELQLESADVRYQVSMARMRMTVMYSRDEASKFDQLNVKDQLRIARQVPFKGLGGLLQDQDQARDRCQDKKDDPWAMDVAPNGADQTKEEKVEVETHRIDTPTPSEPEERGLPSCPPPPWLSGLSPGVMTH